MIASLGPHRISAWLAARSEPAGVIIDIRVGRKATVHGQLACAAVCGVRAACGLLRVRGMAPPSTSAAMSALIWLAIVAVWGFVLIPMWLRHHDNTLEQRSAERFTMAMRVLALRGVPWSGRGSAMRPGASRQGADPASRPARPVFPAESHPPGASASGHAMPGRGPAGKGAGTGRYATPASRRKADAQRLALVRLRRRRLLIIFVAVLMTALLTGLLRGLWIFPQLLADVAFVGYVVHLRRTARADQRLRASRLALDRRIAAERAARYGRQTARPSATGSAAGPWAAGSEPFRLSDPVAVHRDADISDDLMTAAAETVDLTQIAAAAAARAGAAGVSRQSRVVEGAVVGNQGGGVGVGVGGDVRPVDGLVGSAMATEEGVGGDIEGAARTVAGAAGDSADAAYFGYSHAATVDAGFEADGNEDAGWADAEWDSSQEAGSTGGGRSAGRAAGARPNSSKPGRVQVNPPGAHGGLTAGPAPTADSQQPEVGTEDPDEPDELWRRHAVGS